MSFLAKTFFRVRNFMNYSKEFGVRAAWQIARNNSRTDPIATIKLPGIPTPIYYRPRTSDFLVLRQTLASKESDVQLPGRPKLIIDAGANIGVVSLHYAIKYPDASVVAIEPDANNCELFRRNCGAYRNITLIEAALWPRDEALWLSKTELEPWSFRVTKKKAHSAQIRTITMPDVIIASGKPTVDLLKLDIEGAERELFLNNAQEWMPRVGKLVVELHDRFAPGCSDAFFAAIASRPNRHYRSGEYWVVEFLDT